LGELQNNKNVLITAHGNSLRALVMHLENLSPEQIAKFNIPTGVPRKYEFSNQMKLTAVGYLGDQVAIATAINTVSNQSNAENQ
jgi:2,3-bisphosphoglycerate-dependent phosphoglycerate mutase